MKRLVIILLLLCLVSCKTRLSQCGNTYDQNYNGSVKVGDPYSVKNMTYVPKLDPNYDQVGLASWYGHSFHCNKTANGEYFNKNQLSAAHKTLPMPCVVKVTNLANNRSVDVVINDRGPFVKGRIIDLSEKAAIALDMKHHGVATVRVQFLPEETNKLMKEITATKKIYYNNKPKHKTEIIIAEYKEQKLALHTMRKTAKLGKVHLLASKNSYKVILPSSSKVKAKTLLKKVINMGYKDAKIHSY
jgi:rare lipoprotein A